MQKLQNSNSSSAEVCRGVVGRNTSYPILNTLHYVIQMMEHVILSYPPTTGYQSLFHLERLFKSDNCLIWTVNMERHNQITNLPQYQSFLYLEHHLLASLPQWAHFGDPAMIVSSMSRLNVSTHLWVEGEWGKG